MLHSITLTTGWKPSMRQDQSKSLLDLLVKEFRIWETLLRLTREERQALFAENLSVLATLAIQPETFPRTSPHKETLPKK